MPHYGVWMSLSSANEIGTEHRTGSTRVMYLSLRLGVQLQNPGQAWSPVTHEFMGRGLSKSMAKSSDEGHCWLHEIEWTAFVCHAFE